MVATAVGPAGVAALLAGATCPLHPLIAGALAAT